jgi:error-prone DNA polymerase
MASLLERYGWYEWLCHSNFSFLIGASHPGDYVQRAFELGYRGICFTDYDGVYGLARAYRAHQALDMPPTGPKMALHYGAEIHFGKDHDLPIVLQDTIVLIATDAGGYFNLCRLLSRSHKHGKRDAHIGLEEFLSEDLSGLVALMPMRGLIRHQNLDVLSKRWERLRQKFSHRDLYAVVTRLFNPSEDHWIGLTRELAKKHQVPIIYSQDVYMHDSAQKDVSDILQAMRVNRRVDDAVGYMFVNAERSLHGLERIAATYQVFPDFEQALRNSAELAERCEFSFASLRYRYPKEMIPDGYTPQAFLEHVLRESAPMRYPNGLPEKVRLLLDKELELIEHLGFADYFLTVWDIVRWARERGILCQGRGSAANSAICFVLGITEVDPSLFELLFERFMSVERGDPPDIDVDFEHERREEVIQYIYQRYGRERAAMVANVICFKTRGCIRFVAKALGMSDRAIEIAGEYLSVRQHRRQVMPEIFAQMAKHPELGNECPQRLRVWGTIAQRIKGFPRHLGIHSGGFVIADCSIDHLVAQEPATMEGRSVIQWSKEDIEALGFFKIDILSLGMLTAIRKCLDLVNTRNDHTGLSLAKIPQDDAATYQMIQRADTVGVFQIESRAQMSMLPRLKPRCFYDLVVEVAIIRPGPITGGLIHPYLSRREGREPIRYAHPKLVSVLQRTMGVPIFQEQVMRIAMEVGDFTPGQADALRRHMGSWQIKGDLNPWIERLVIGMRRHQIEEEFITQLIGQLKGFAEYGFPESHAASFALLAYASSYLKCHYPAAFTVALLNSQPMGFYSPHALLTDARRHHVEVLPVCVEHSFWDTTLERRSSGGDAIRLGMRLVHSLRKDAAERLIKRRKDGWGTLSDFIKRSGLARPDLACLAAADALQVYGVQRRDAVWLAEAAEFCEYLEDVDLWHQFPKEGSFEKISQDFRATSTTLGEHPSAVLKQQAWSYPVPIKQLSTSKELDLVQASTVFVFGMVLVRQAPPSAKGMVFFTLEDEHGFLNLVFTPQTFEKFSSLVHRQSFLCVSGRLQRQGLAYSILVQRVYEPVQKKAEVIPIPDREEDQARDYREHLYGGRNYM